MQSAHNYSDVIRQFTFGEAEDLRLESSFFPILNLPDEVLVEVAQNLDYNSLCELMMVNRRFLELVHGNRRLWNKFRLNIVGPRCHFNMPSAKRRFDSVDVRYVNCNKGLLLNFATDIKQIKLSDCFSSPVELVGFLQTMPNLEQIKMYDQRFINNDYDAVQPQDLPEFEKLTELVYLSDVGTQIFTNAKNLRKLSCDSVYPDLLIKQKQLIDLNIGFDLKKSSIFSEDFTDQVTFRLETLIVADPGLNDDNIDIEGKQKVLAKFINLHQHHLKYLHIWAPVQSTCMRTFLINLKFLQRLNLTLRDAGFEVDPELISQMKATKLPVKDLELEVNNSMYEAEVWNMHLLGKFIECFPNVCFLKLNFFTINNDEYALKISKEFNPKLENIEMSFACESKILKHVELVELEDVNLLFSKPKSSPEQWHQFLSTNPNIRNLKIIDRKFNNECFRELTTLKELRHVNIKSDLLNSSETITYAEMICENCPNLVGMTLEIFSPDDTASDDSSDVEESVEMSDEEDSELSDEDENFDTDTSF